MLGLYPYYPPNIALKVGDKVRIRENKNLYNAFAGKIGIIVKVRDKAPMYKVEYGRNHMYYNASELERVNA